jgi:hypothetical protein
MLTEKCEPASAVYLTFSFKQPTVKDQTVHTSMNIILYSMISSLPFRLSRLEETSNLHAFDYRLHVLTSFTPFQSLPPYNQVSEI